MKYYLLFILCSLSSFWVFTSSDEVDLQQVLSNGLKIEGSIIKCPNCNLSYSSAAQIKKHYFENHQNSIRQHVLGWQAQDLAWPMRRYTSNNNRNVFMCLACEKYFSSNYNQHKCIASEFILTLEENKFLIELIKQGKISLNL